MRQATCLKDEVLKFQKYDDPYTLASPDAITMILTFDNKFDQIDEADCMFIFQIKHQYSF